MSPTRQSARHIMMIRPARFGANIQTESSNAFQSIQEQETEQEVQQTALREFDNFVYQLRQNKVDVLVMEDTSEPHKPDAVFPNNWISMHPNGQVVLYPMEAPNRRLEKRKDIVEKLSVSGFQVKNIEDLSKYESENRHLEGTGSLVFDHLHQKVYACISSRTNRDLVEELAQKWGYTPVIFEAKDTDGKPIYHTNVVMCIGTDYAVICADSIADEKERQDVLTHLKNDGLEIILISQEQMYHFAGNMLEIENRKGERLLVMSQTAFNQLEGAQRHQLSTHARILAVEIPTIERYGGGSARCMMAEIFLPKAS